MVLFQTFAAIRFGKGLSLRHTPVAKVEALPAPLSEPDRLAEQLPVIAPGAAARMSAGFNPRAAAARMRAGARLWRRPGQA